MKSSWRASAKASRYPLGTIATYGPTSVLATTLVASVLQKEKDREPSATRIWMRQAVDVRHDQTVAADVARFLQEHGVKESVTSDRIIGCPHEEGIDYPMGRSCPRCPFWAGIDRFTHEPLKLAAPTMSPSQILAELCATRSVPPHEALASADGHRQALLDELLDVMQSVLDDPEAASEERRRCSDRRCTWSPSGASLGRSATSSAGCLFPTKAPSTSPGTSSRRMVRGSWRRSVTGIWRRSKR